ncbi:site-specific integrase [Streptomyces capparidis]
MAENEGKKRTRQPNGASSIYFGKDGRWHGRVTVGVKDDGTPDRPHVSRKTRPEIVKAVRALENERDNGKVRKAGSKSWTVKAWLTHWVENIAAPAVGVNTIAGYRVAVYHHLIPGLGAHRLNKLEPEHLERFYRRMQENGSKPATAHQAHRTVRVALNEAVRRKHITENPATIAKAPQVTVEEVEPYTVEEVQRLLLEAGRRPNGSRWAVALALGLRQGEALGLKWSDVDLAAGVLRVRRSRLRPKYAHGCGETCGKKAGYCPERKPIRQATKDTKSRAGKRSVGLPPQLISLLAAHQKEQEKARADARQLWHDEGWVFADEQGRAINPRTDYSEWKRLLDAAGVRDGRLHDARHTAATVLLILGVTERAVMGTMGWSTTAMAARYQHLVEPVRKDIAHRVDGLLWKPADGGSEAPEEGGEGPGRAN